MQGSASALRKHHGKRTLDDGDESLYQLRLARLRERLSLADPAARKRRREEARELADQGEGEDSVQRAFQERMVKQQACVILVCFVFHRKIDKKKILI